MLYCLFRHAAAHSVRGFAVRAGERILIENAPATRLEVAARKIGVPLARRIAGRGLSRWLPVVGAAASPATPTTTRCASPTPRSSCSAPSSSTPSTPTIIDGEIVDASESLSSSEAPRIKVECPRREHTPARITSIDAFRGFVMFLMLAEAMRLWTLHDAFPDSRFWAIVAYNTEHVPWQGCSLHDLIQPAFSFLVGAALPFSIASRRARGQALRRACSGTPSGAAWR